VCLCHLPWVQQEHTRKHDDNIVAPAAAAQLPAPGEIQFAAQSPGVDHAAVAGRAALLQQAAGQLQCLAVWLPAGISAHHNVRSTLEDVDL
jgi:hypothetical protein